MARDRENLVSNVETADLCLLMIRSLFSGHFLPSRLKHILNKLRFKSKLDEKIQFNCFRVHNTFCDSLFQRGVVD